MAEQNDDQFERFEQWVRQTPRVREIINKTNRRIGILNFGLRVTRMVMILAFVGGGFYADRYYNTFPVFTVIGLFAMVGVYFEEPKLTLQELYQQLLKKRRRN